jgi:drug/metabolite transporter (DMT)-like permease
MLSVKSALLSLTALVAFGISYAVVQSFALDQRDFVALLIAVLAIQSTAAIAILSGVFNRFDPSRTLSTES